MATDDDRPPLAGRDLEQAQPLLDEAVDLNIDVKRVADHADDCAAGLLSMLKAQDVALTGLLNLFSRDDEHGNERCA